jgi:drug/metabolite transporter (DMT)-like permease
MSQVGVLFNYFKKHTKKRVGGFAPYIALFFVCIGWGTTWLASKNAIQAPMSVWQIAGLRQFFGALIYLSYFIAQGHRMPKGNEWRDILILAILNFVCSNGLSTWAVKYIDSGIGAVLGALYPIWLLIITSLFFSKDSLKPLGIVGIIIGFIGVILVFTPKIIHAQSKNVWLGVILCTASTITWAFSSIYTKKKAKGYNAYFSIGWQMLLSSLLMTAYSWLAGDAVAYQSIPPKVWFNIFYLVIVGSVICFGCYLFALQRMSAGQVSVYAYINPIVAIFVGWWLGKETPTVFLFVGSGIALFGVFLVQWSMRSK